MTQAIIYCRFSPRRNGDECTSNDVQLAYCEKYCEERNYEVAGRFSDANASGSDEKRQGMWDAIWSTKRGGVLVVYKPDRLARSVYLDEYVRRELKKRGATVEAVEGGREGETPHDVMVRQILSAVAEHERRIIAARTKAYMLHHQSTGRAMSNLPPYGKQRGPDVEIIKNGKTKLQRTWVANEGEQTVITKIVSYREDGSKVGFREIARRLNNENTPCRGKRWHHNTIKNICTRNNV